MLIVHRSKGLSHRMEFLKIECFHQYLKKIENL